MKLLLDTCAWGGAKLLLQQTGYDALWIGEELVDPGDSAILDRATTERLPNGEFW